MTYDIDCVVIGAGVIGLAAARELAMAGREVLLVEKTPSIGNGVSSRNSEVIHAGIYYPKNSLKARFCVLGKQLLYQYCADRGIAHQRLGKLIVAAAPEQTAQLAAISARARENGVNDLYQITSAQARELEPALSCDAALVSPSTGIIDTHALMLALQGDAENHGAQCVFHTRFSHGKTLSPGGFELNFDGAESMTLTAAHVVNAAGLWAPHVAGSIEGLSAKYIPEAYFCKGSYFSLTGRSPFKHLIYPLPNDAGLGVHLTLDLNGQAKFGPDTEWVEDEDYTIDPTRAEAFYSAVRQYWPALPNGALQPDYTGIRPKIVSRNEPAADFRIDGERTHGIPGLLNLFGIESPGLTACLAIGRAARDTLGFG